MIGLGSFLAVGLAGFMAGMAFAALNHRGALRDAAIAQTIVIGCEGFVLTKLPQREVSARTASEIVAIQGGKPRGTT